MKAISLWQPWASLWLSTAKVHETRHWPTPVRGTIAVHAAKKFVKTADEDLGPILEDEFGGHWSKDLPTGALIGTLELIDCTMITSDEHGVMVAAGSDDFMCGDFSGGRFAWRRGTYRVFQTPIPYIGRQGWFDVADDLVGRTR